MGVDETEPGTDTVGEGIRALVGDGLGGRDRVGVDWVEPGMKIGVGKTYGMRVGSGMAFVGVGDSGKVGISVMVGVGVGVKVMVGVSEGRGVGTIICCSIDGSSTIGAAVGRVAT